MPQPVETEAAAYSKRAPATRLSLSITDTKNDRRRLAHQERRLHMRCLATLQMREVTDTLLCLSLEMGECRECPRP